MTGHRRKLLSSSAAVSKSGARHERSRTGASDALAHLRRRRSGRAGTYARHDGDGTSTTRPRERGRAMTGIMANVRRSGRRGFRSCRAGKPPTRQRRVPRAYAPEASETRLSGPLCAQAAARLPRDGPARARRARVGEMTPDRVRPGRLGPGERGGSDTGRAHPGEGPPPQERRTTAKGVGIGIVAARTRRSEDVPPRGSGGVEGNWPRRNGTARSSGAADHLFRSAPRAMGFSFASDAASARACSSRAPPSEARVAGVSAPVPHPVRRRGRPMVLVPGARARGSGAGVYSYMRTAGRRRRFRRVGIGSVYPWRLVPRTGQLVAWPAAVAGARRWLRCWK